VETGDCIRLKPGSWKVKGKKVKPCVGACVDRARRLSVQKSDAAKQVSCEYDKKTCVMRAKEGEMDAKYDRELVVVSCYGIICRTDRCDVIVRGGETTVMTTDISYHHHHHHHHHREITFYLSS